MRRRGHGKGSQIFRGIQGPSGPGGSGWRPDPGRAGQETRRPPKHDRLLEEAGQGGSAGGILEGSVFFGPYPVVASRGSARYWLSQNVPNPFGPGSGTSIRYSVARAGEVRLRILDVAGRLVRVIEERAGLGVNTIVWDGTDREGRRLASGVYFYDLKAGDFSARKRMLLVE